MALRFRKVSRLSRYMKIAAAAGSTGAAIVSFLYSYGIAGDANSHLTIGNYGAAWIGLAPAVDTAESIGDTLHLAATITDQNGSVLVGARPTWSSSDVRVATVMNDGSVIARSSGATTIVAVVGDRTAKARIVVRQQVATVSVEADSTLSLPEGHTHALQARAADARGYTVPGRSVRWRVDDTTIVRLDSTGRIEGLVPGRAVANATIDGVSGHALVNVVSIPATLTLVNEEIPRMSAGSTLPNPIMVRVLSRTGHPVEGALVRFRRSDGEGPAEGAVSVTDASGRARTTWTLGAFPGRQTLLATVDHVDSALAIVAEVDPVLANTRTTLLGDEPTGTVGMAIAEPVGIRVADTTGRPLADVPVSWTTLDGGAIEGLTARTDSLGQARARWTLGSGAGKQRAHAMIGSARAMPPVVLTAAAKPGVPVRVAIAAGDGQRSSAGARLSAPVVVQAFDAKDNPVPNAVLNISPLAGSVADSSVRTDSTGRAEIRWTMGRMAGPHALSVKLAGVERALRVTATASSAAAENVSIERVPPVSKTPSRDVNFIATVSDVYGNPVSGARVSLVAESGTVSPANAVSDAKGRVTGMWKLAAKTEEQTLRATLKGSQTRGALTATAPVGSPAVTPAASPTKAVAPKPAGAKPATVKPATPSRPAATKKPVAKKPAPKTTTRRP